MVYVDIQCLPCTQIQPSNICHVHLLVSVLWLCHTVLKELQKGSIDHSWLLVRCTLLLAPPILAFSHECPGMLPSVDLSND